MSDNLANFERALLNYEDGETVDLCLLASIAKNFTEDDISACRENHDELQAYLDDLQLGELSIDELDAVIALGKIHTHFVCTLFYSGSHQNLLASNQIDEIIALELCDEDSGRSDSCYGVHFFVALQENISTNQLRALMSIDHYDSAFFPWLIARSNQASEELLTEVLENFTNAHSWRVSGFYTEENSLLGEDDLVGRYVLNVLSKNSIISAQAHLKFGKKIEFLMSSVGRSEDEIEKGLIEITD